MRLSLKYLALLFPSILFCINGFTTVSDDAKLMELELSLKKTDRQLKVVNQKISDTQLDLSQKNEKYVYLLSFQQKMTKELTRLEREIFMLEEALDVLKKSLQVGLLNLTRLQSHGEGVSNLIEKNIENSKLKERTRKYGVLKEKLSLLQKNYINSKSDLIEIKNETAAVHKILLELEAKKGGFIEEYYENVAKKKVSEIEKDIRLENIKERVEHLDVEKVSDFSMPLNHVVDKNVNSEGAELFYESIEPVFASASGKIIYLNELSSYGKVLIIDHGNNLKTVLLGQVDYSVRQGDLVTRKEVIGRAKCEKGKICKLYLELRKAEENLSLSKYFNLTTKI